MSGTATPERTAETEDGAVAADPSTAPVDVKVYIVTGTNNLRLPESFCKECSLFVDAVNSALEKINVPVNVNVYSWWTHFLGALRHGGYHPPVMVVGGKRLCQGHHVPSEEEVVEAVKDAVRGRNGENEGDEEVA